MGWSRNKAFSSAYFMYLAFVLYLRGNCTNVFTSNWLVTYLLLFTTYFWSIIRSTYFHQYTGTQKVFFILNPEDSRISRALSTHNDITFLARFPRGLSKRRNLPLSIFVESNISHLLKHCGNFWIRTFRFGSLIASFAAKHCNTSYLTRWSWCNTVKPGNYGHPRDCEKLSWFLRWSYFSGPFLCTE